MTASQDPDDLLEHEVNEELRDSVADGQAARWLVGQVARVGRLSGRHPVRTLLLKLSHGRIRLNRRLPDLEQLATPWRDASAFYRDADLGWRQRTGWIAGQEVFGVDYLICRRCDIGWVEEPYTEPRYQRQGVAAAALAALRCEHPGLEWHTAGGHFRDVTPFWDEVGAEVPGSYSWRRPCRHVRR